MTGPLPDLTGISGNITILNLEDNKFNSSVPSSISLCSKLNQLGLGSGVLYGQNKFTGSLPTSFAKLTQLTYLSLNNNDQMKDTTYAGFPSLTFFFSSLVNLQVLFLDSTNFHGSIPFSLCKITRLTTGRNIQKYPCCLSATVFCIPPALPSNCPSVAPIPCGTYQPTSQPV